MAKAAIEYFFKRLSENPPEKPPFVHDRLEGAPIYIIDDGGFEFSNVTLKAMLDRHQVALYPLPPDDSEE